MITPTEIRMARAALGWSQQELADRLHMNQSGIARIEGGGLGLSDKTAKKIKKVFIDNGVVFNRGAVVPPGAKI